MESVSYSSTGLVADLKLDSSRVRADEAATTPISTLRLEVKYHLNNMLQFKVTPPQNSPDVLFVGIQRAFYSQIYVSQTEAALCKYVSPSNQLLLLLACIFFLPWNPNTQFYTEIT